MSKDTSELIIRKSINLRFWPSSFSFILSLVIAQKKFRFSRACHIYVKVFLISWNIYGC